MSESKPTVEIVRGTSDQPWHARVVGGNGEIVWVTESYAHREGAINAVSLLAVVTAGRSVEISDVDLRVVKP